MAGSSNLDEYTVIRSDNRDVERTQLNKILKRLKDGSGTGIVFDGGSPSSDFGTVPAVIDLGGVT